MALMFLNDPPPDAGVEAMFEADAADDGYVQNFIRLWGWRPDVFKGFLDARATLASTMSLTEREFALVVVATVSQRSDSYCSLAWGTKLAASSDGDLAAAVLRGDASALSEREAALASWARTVAHDANATTAGDVEGLRAVGLSDRDIFEVTALIAFRQAFSTINDALGAMPDRQLAEAAPPPVRQAVDYGRPADLHPSTR